MRQAAAKQGDLIRGLDTHIINDPSGPKSVKLPFTGALIGGLSPNVSIMGLPAAIEGSTARNDITPHPPGLPYLRPPANKAQITMCTSTVRINGKAAARNGDTAITCNDPVDLPEGKVITSGTVTVMMG
jgi:uncharacterized Zn-binding protein involved in type VI secretion